MAEKLQSFVLFFIVFSFSLLAISSQALQSRAAGSNLQAAARRREALESPSKASELWCVAKNNAEDAALQSALNWACGVGKADCSAIQQSGPCFEPQDIQSYASYAFNDYFLKNGLTKDSCDFGGCAALTSLNPSHGNCKFPSGYGSLSLVLDWFILSGLGPQPKSLYYRHVRHLGIAAHVLSALLLGMGTLWG